MSAPQENKTWYVVSEGVVCGFGAYQNMESARFNAKQLAKETPGKVFRIVGTEEAYYSEPMLYSMDIIYR